MFIAVATFRDHLYVASYRKPYKMCYIGDFIMKSLSREIDVFRLKNL